MPRRNGLSSLLTFSILVASLAAKFPCLAQQRRSNAPRVLTAADYARAEKFMSYKTNPLVFHAGVRPTWLADDRFWYRNVTPDGSEFVLVDPVKRTRGAAFDHAKVAAALSAAVGITYNASQLPFTQFDLAADGKTISFNVRGRSWICDLQASRCTGVRNSDAASLRPSGTRAGRSGPGDRNDVVCGCSFTPRARLDGSKWAGPA